MYAYEKMTPKEIITSFEKASEHVMLSPALTYWYTEITKLFLPRIERIRTVGGLEKAFREYKDHCMKYDECNGCKFADKEFGTAECFKRFLEEEV